MRNMDPFSALASSPLSRDWRQTVPIDNRKMERLHLALAIQQKALQYFETSILKPLRFEMTKSPKPTLAQLTKELRLTRLVEILKGCLGAERHLTTWFKNLKSPLEQDIENELERTLQTIERANECIWKEWTIPDVKPDDTSPTSFSKGNHRKSGSKQQPLQRRVSYNLDTSIFRDEEDDDDELIKRDVLEHKIASLHRSLYRIIPALKQLIEVICDSVTRSPDAQKLGLTGSDMYLLMMKFPQTYVLSEEGEGREDVRRVSMGRNASIEIHSY